MTDGPTQYNGIAKIVHWWIAGMIVLQFVLANLAERAEDAGSPLQQLELLANHRSVGITILVVAIFRLFWRTFKAPPAPLPMPAWQRTASYVSHWTLYGLLFLMPVTGWLMSSASGSAVGWFNLLQLPHLVGPDEGLEATLEEVHGTLAKVMFVVAATHIAAGLKHAFINRDGALRRISSPLSVAVFVIVIVGGLVALSKVDGDAAAPTAPEATISETSISPQPDEGQQ